MNLKQLTELPKGELHVHLNGLVKTSIAEELITKHNPNLLKKFNIRQEITRDTPASSLAEYLNPWKLLRLFPIGKDELSIIVASAFEHLQKQNVRFVELRSSIIYISQINTISIEESLDWLINEISAASVKYNITAGLIITISRGDTASHHLNSLLAAYKALGCPNEVIGLDLAGDENTPFPPSLPGLFTKAKKELGLGITIHAGETGNSDNIIQAIELFGADRIGHGTAAIQSQKVIELIKLKDICIEVCPISNRLTNAVKPEDSHPAILFIENQIPFVICSDNPAIHNKGIFDDYLMFLNESNNQASIARMFELQSRYSFLWRKHENPFCFQKQA